MIYRSHVLVCAGTGCTSSHSLRIIENFHKKLEETGYDKEVQVIRTGCFGRCAAGPVGVVYPEGIYYSHVKPEDVEEIVNEHIIKGRPVQRLIYKEHDESGVNTTLNDSDFYKKQHRIALRTCGMIGEVVGMAASVCMKRNALPRDIYTTYFADLQELMRKGTGRTDVPYTQFYHQVDRTGHQAEDR